MRLKNPIHPVLVLATVLIIHPWMSAETPAKADFDERPMPVKSVAPAYPADMKRAGASGIVTLTVSVDENGDVLDEVVAKSTRPEFEPAAIEAVAKWKFKPARKAGVAVKSRITIPIKFSADSES